MLSTTISHGNHVRSNQRRTLKGAKRKVIQFRTQHCGTITVARHLTSSYQQREATPVWHFLSHNPAIEGSLVWMGVSQKTEGKPTMDNGDLLGAPLGKKEKPAKVSALLPWRAWNSSPPWWYTTVASARETSTQTNGPVQVASVPVVLKLSFPQEIGGNSKWISSWIHWIKCISISTSHGKHSLSPTGRG